MKNQDRALLDEVYVDEPDDLTIVGKKVLETLLENMDGKYKGHLRCVVEIHLECVHTVHLGHK